MKRNSPPLGSVFLVPLRDSGYGTGVVARSTGQGDCLGYFFGPRIRNEADVDVSQLQASRAILVGMFGDLDLINRNWPVVGNIPRWNPADWPVPRMARLDEAANRAWVSTYDDDLHCVNEEEISPAEALQYPYDRMMGSGAVEIRLTKLLGSPAE